MERIAFIGMTASNMEQVFAHTGLSFLPHSQISNHLTTAYFPSRTRAVYKSCYTLGATHTA